MESIGLEDDTWGPRDFTDEEPTPPRPTGSLTIEGRAAQDLAANPDGLPRDGMSGVDLSGISPGGGLAPQDHDWSTMHPSELAVPQANLVIPVVDKGLLDIDQATLEMDLPVSFQAGRLSSSSPIDADAGTTVIAGHVNWSDGSWAPMSNLYNAEPGMTVVTTDHRGGTHRWTITKSSSVPQSDLSHLFTLTDTDGPRQLILITCEATTNNDGQLIFDKNHVVTAVPAVE